MSPKIGCLALFTLGQTFDYVHCPTPSLAWKKADVFKINGDDGYATTVSVLDIG